MWLPPVAKTRTIGKTIALQSGSWGKALANMTDPSEAHCIRFRKNFCGEKYHYSGGLLIRTFVSMATILMENQG